MRLKVFYLDDEPLLLEVFSDLFASEEIEIRTFSDPAKALDAVRESPPDLIVLDHRLPGTTGDRIAAQMDPKIPKILVTGDLEVACGSSFVAKFYKPFELDEIRKFLQSFSDKSD